MPAPAKILLVDDHPANVLALTAVLEPLGQPIVVARSGEEAVAFATKDDFAVVLMDIKLPGINGLEAAAQMRSIARARRVPIIFLTGFDHDPANILRAYAQGGVDYLVKPFDSEILRSKVAVFVDLFSMRTQARQTEERFRLFVESVIDYAIFILDPKGTITTWNLGAERIKGYKADEIVGQHFSRFYTEEEVLAGKCEYELKEAARIGRFEDVGWRVRKDGSRFWANVVITAVRDPEDGELLGFSKVTRDLTERKAAEDELTEQIRARREVEVLRALENASLERERKSREEVAAALIRERTVREEAERAVRFNELFVGILGHDLRNPMSAIAMGANLLLRSVGTEKEMKVTRRIAASAERMARMIDQLLDFTRIRIGGGLALNLERTDMYSLCQRVVEELETAHPEYALSLELQGNDSTGEWDADRILQALSNLVGNAIAHGVVGRPVSLRIESHAERVSVFVHNDGVVPPEILPVIFDPFRGSQRKERKGLGLGLYITQQIVAAHRGTVTVASSETEGTTFCVDVPRSVSGAPACLQRT